MRVELARPPESCVLPEPAPPGPPPPEPTPPGPVPPPKPKDPSTRKSPDRELPGAPMPAREPLLDARFRAERLAGGGAAGAFSRVVRVRRRFVTPTGGAASEEATGFVMVDWPQCVVTAGHLFRTPGRTTLVEIACPERGGATAQAESYAAYRAGKGPDLAVICFASSLLAGDEGGFFAFVPEGRVQGFVRGYPLGEDHAHEMVIDSDPPFGGKLRYGAAPGRGMSGAPVFSADDVVGAHTELVAPGGPGVAAALDPDTWNECMRAAFAVRGREATS